MDRQTQNEFLPDYVSPPGDTLLETIHAIGMRQAELAERAGRPKKTINGIVKGRTAITPQTAIEFERVLGIPASFWNNRQRRYDEYKARCQEQEELEQQTEWLKLFPVARMAKLGWIKPVRGIAEKVRQLLIFFGVASPDAWEEYWGNVKIAYHKSPSFDADPWALDAWLRRGELVAQGISCQPYDRARFKKALTEIRAMTNEPPEVFQPKLIRLSATCGVALTFVRALPKTRVSGASRWVTADKALIQLSLRHKTDDHLWFTFFHEAGHVLLNDKTPIFVDCERSRAEQTSRVPELEGEARANDFASEILVPRKALRQAFAVSRRISEASIRRFAEEQGVAPGIVVGRLQHDAYIPWLHCNGLKRRLCWREA